MSVISKYRVLWVDDDETITISFPPYVEEKYNITLDIATNWEDAEILLRTNFNEYSAIILDAYCRVKSTDKLPNNLFLGQVSSRLSLIFGEKQSFIPWYVLSAGTMDNFDIVRSIIETEERKKMEPLWGKMLYKKESSLEVSEEVDKLLKNIRKIAAEKTTNKVLLRHADVFKYLGKEEYVDYEKSRRYILKMLSALYHPEENLNFVYEGNPLRHVVEYLFRTAKDFGILPDECFDNDDHVILLDSSRFLAGIAIRCFDKKDRNKVNYYKRIRPEEKSVFSEDESDRVREILNFSNAWSHTSKYDPYVIEEDKKEIFFGYVLLLCHAIKSFGRYLECHPNKETNLSNIEKIFVPAQGDQVEIGKCSGKAVLKEYPECILNDSYLDSIGKFVVVGDISENKDKKGAVDFPLFVNVKNPMNRTNKSSNYSRKPFDEDKPKVVFNTEIPSKEELLKEGIITLDKRGTNAMLGNYCKLPPEFKKYVAQKIRVLELEDNSGSDNKEIPYVATKAELVEEKLKTNPDQDADAILATLNK